MKRHPALQDYSRDHHLLLLQAREIRWCAVASPHASPIERVVSHFLAAWEAEIVPHLHEEEQVLLPFYAQHAGAVQGYLSQIYEAHAWLRARVSELAAQTARDEVGPLLGQIGQRLHEHVRFEERTFFPHLQALFSEQAMQTLAAQRLAYRQQHRPHAIGARR